MDKTQRGIITSAVIIVSGLILYPLERSSYEVSTVTGFGQETKTYVSGHDWLWNVEAIAFDYMALEVLLIGAVLGALYWYFTAG